MTRRTRRLLFAAFSGGLLVIVAALLLPAYDTQSATSSGGLRSGTATLVAVNGPRVLLVAALPALVTLLVVAALEIAERRRSHLARRLATALVACLAIVNVLALLSIGVLWLPVTALLVMAVRRPRPARLTPARP
jgi:hypothetical protein